MLFFAERDYGKELYQEDNISNKEANSNEEVKMKIESGIIRFFKGIIFLGLVLVLSGCILKLLIPAPERSFELKDLVITSDDLPAQWAVVFGSQLVSDNTKPSNSLEIAFWKSTAGKLPGEEKWEVKEMLYRFSSIEGAKEDYAVTTSFPGETNIEGWTFKSDLADEQKFSCYTYSNMDYPVCRWVGRYDEIEVEVIAWIDPNRLSLEEVQDLIVKIDERIATNIEK